MNLATITHVDDDIRDEVITELDRRLRRCADDATAHGPEFRSLWTLACETVRGGKLLRPVLFVKAVQSLGGADPVATRQLAAAIEMLHYAFVLHDDVIDGDLMRRHRLNLQGTVRAQHPDPDSAAALHWAETTGILMGDLLLSSVHQLFARLDVPHPTRLHLLDLLEDTITETVAGEMLDVGLSDGAIAADLTTTLQMTQRKTAAYTFALPLRAAAVLTDASGAVERTLDAAGRHLGYAFQLQDDLLGAFGDAAQHGKDARSDYREGKQTALISYARHTEHWPTIAAHLAAADDPRHDTALATALDACGARRFVADLVDDKLTAVTHLTDTDPLLPDAVRALLRWQTDHLRGRRA